MPPCLGLFFFAKLEIFVNGDIQLCVCVVAIIVVNIVNDVLEIRAGI